MELRVCTKCVMPETHETIMYDAKGVCNICHQHEYKHEKIDWPKKEAEFKEIVEKYRNKQTYDCIIPFSGGKDSVFVLYTMLKRYNVKPLVVSFDHGFYRPHHVQQRDRILRKLGVDFMLFRPNQQIVRKLTLESLIRKGDFCWHCHTGIFSYPMHIAVKFKIPLLVWGESTAEYTSYNDFDNIDERDETAFNKWINLGITADDMVGMVSGGIEPRDLECYRYPKLRDLKAINYRSICYGAYHEWDVRKHMEIISRELGWEGDEVEGVPQQYNFTKVECMMNGIRDYLKYIKRGYGRTSQLVTDDIRAGVLERDKAMAWVKQCDGKKPASLRVFLDFVGITEEEFNEIAVKHAVSPWTVDPQQLPEGKELYDQKDWDLSFGGKSL